MINVIGQVSEWLKGFLPLSPFLMLESVVIDQEWLKVLNWFVPVGLCLSVLELWLSGIVIYYMISGILRFAHLIS